MKRMHRIYFSIAIVVGIILIISLVGLFLKSIPTQAHYSAKIVICTNSTFPYILHLPLPIDSNGSLSETILNKLVVTSGNGTYSIIQTERGLALNITGVGNMTLEANGIVTNAHYYEIFNMLSMQNVTQKNNETEPRPHGYIEYWVYCKYTDEKFEEPIFLSWDYSTSQKSRYFSSEGGHLRAYFKGCITRDGWSIIIGEQEEWVP